METKETFTVYGVTRKWSLDHLPTPIIGYCQSCIWIECNEEEAKAFARENKAVRLQRGRHHYNKKDHQTLDKCDACRGGGIYYWGAIVNGVPTHSGPCFRCQAKGIQTVEDRKRNYYYDIHRKVI